VGIQSQREIEQAVRAGVASGKLDGAAVLKASVQLKLSGTEVDVMIEDDIKLS
jgi:hypothetical protein